VADLVVRLCDVTKTTVSWWLEARASA